MNKLIDGPDDAPATFLFAHGAGAGMDHEFMTSVATGVAAKGIRVVRFEFPYMIKRREDGRKRPPDRMPKLLDAYREEVQALEDRGPLVIGGKSMGGRVASLLAIETEQARKIAGLICLGFPFHPPGKPENFRGEHLAAIGVPTLILQGERDSFGRREELEDYPLSERVRCRYLPDGDHSFKPRKASGFTLDQHLATAIEAIVDFITGQRIN